MTPWTPFPPRRRGPRHRVFLTYAGETRALAEWAQLPWVQARGLTYACLYHRWKRYGQDDRVLTAPLREESSFVAAVAAYLAGER